jgi:hypothetical protein
VAGEGTRAIPGTAAIRACKAVQITAAVGTAGAQVEIGRQNLGQPLIDRITETTRP